MSKPIDIDNKELVLYHQRKHILKRLLRFSAEEIAPIISRLVIENCTGCYGHLSQTNHQCLTMEKDEQLLLYFDRALEKASGTNVMTALKGSLNNMNLYKPIEYTVDDWKSIFCVEHRQALKNIIFQLP